MAIKTFTIMGVEVLQEKGEEEDRYSFTLNGKKYAQKIVHSFEDDEEHMLKIAEMTIKHVIHTR